MFQETNNKDGGKQTILTEKQGTTFLVSIHRPEVRNALDRQMASALAEAFRAFDQDESLLVAVLSGSEGTFCSGFDLKAVADETHSPQVSDAQQTGLLHLHGSGHTYRDNKTDVPTDGRKQLFTNCKWLLRNRENTLQDS